MVSVYKKKQKTKKQKKKKTKKKNKKKKKNRMANRVDPDERHVTSRLIFICTVFKGKN